MSLPEHHLDVVYTPGSIEEQSPRVPLSRVLGAFLLPLFFILSFTLAYSSALNAPKPHDLALQLAGPSGTTQQIATGIRQQASGGFDITRTTSDADAVAAVRDRSAVGALLIGSGSTPTVTTVIASGGGALAATTLRQVGAQVADQLHTTAIVRDVAPLDADDSTGSGMFYLVLLCTIGGYLTITVLFQAFPTARRRTRILVAVGAAVVVPLLVTAATSFSLGILGMDFGQLAAVLGTEMLYTLAVALIALVLTEVLGQAAIFAIVLLLMAFNFPSTGGTAPEAMLPPFWQAIHAVWVGSGAFEAIRSFVYFGGNGFGWPFARVLIWLGGTVLTLAAVYLVRQRRASSAAAPDEHLVTAAAAAPASAIA
ncbi:hypothetical protein [Jatrophihabitans endophyticus]|uniref:hypothetical protein n=1 Tax=Jatrophihabitans endophyticus TaxID=1206085 RepID=UPI001A08EA12|nr:hypothetical protein [Jatrophihabitans endophyticus]MBE7189816.1 hypothetical protein [Jatrophihabitans endophyticus]